LLRPGRFDVIVELPLPDEASRLAILKVHCRRRRLGADVSLETIAAATGGMTGADLEALCRQASMQVIRESMEQDPGDDFATFVVERRHFEAAMADLIRTGGVLEQKPQLSG
jgi:transitional endoplasmic reticulum ATPase